MSEWQVEQGEALEMLQRVPDGLVDAVVTDPPYELGFMGKSWDASGVAYSVGLWREVLRVLKPGGHLLAFGGSRTYHRMACAIEDAGFEIRDQLQWLYGCLDDQTEALTRRGWVGHGALRVEDDVLQWDAETGALSWVSPSEILRYPFRGSMSRLTNRHTDQVLTPNHRVYARIRRHSRKPAPVSFEVVEAGALAARPSGWQVDLPMAGILEGSVEVDPERAYLVGWWMTDAWAHGDGKACMFSQCKLQTLEKLSAALAPYSPSIYRRAARKDNQHGETAFYVTGELAHYLLSRFPERRLTWEMLDWKLNARRRLVAGLLDGDGSQPAGDHVVTFWSKNEERRSIFVALCVSIGWRAYEDSKKGAVYANEATNTTQIQAKHRAPDVLYDGVVWCVRVPTGAFVVRRKGRPFITGNSGFPKSLDVSKAIDKAAGVGPTVVGSRDYRSAFNSGGTHQAFEGETHAAPVAITVPTTDEAKRWQGWGTALKPAHEPIVLARKPLVGTVAANVLAHGAGAINVDGCRIGTDKVATRINTNIQGGNFSNARGQHATGFVVSEHEGRFPANVLLDEEAGAVLDAQAGVRKSGEWKGQLAGATGPANGTTHGNRSKVPLVRAADIGSASRFFYCAKSSTSERDAGCEGLRREIGGRVVEGNHHPTVKPISLMRWLCRLVTAPGGLILDPFCGSGTTGCAAVLEGFNFAGVDLDRDDEGRSLGYVEVARARIAHWHRNGGTRA